MANQFKSRLHDEKAKAISNSLKDAIIFLNSQKIEEGKLYSKRYFSNKEKSKVDVVLALGVLSGVGSECYSIISRSGKIIVWDIVTTLPDVSEVTQGQLYIYWDTVRETSFLVYLKSENRIVEPLQFPVIVYNISDGHLYYVSSESIVDIYEHLENTSYFEERLTALEEKVQEILEGGDVPVDPTPTPPPSDPDEPGGDPGIALKILSFTMDTENIYEVGSSISPTFSWSYNLPINTQSINGVNVESSLREKTFENVTTTTIFKLMATDGYTTADKSQTITFSPLFYSGPGRIKVDAITSDNFYEIFSSDLMNTGFSEVECVGTVTKTFTFEQKSYVLLAIPTDKTKNLKIYDLNNFEVTWYMKDISVTNSYGKSIKYTVFQSPSASTESTYVFKF